MFLTKPKPISNRSAIISPEIILIEAMAFIGELREQCETLADMPRAFPLVPRYEGRGIRRRVFGNYLIFYRIDAEQITVLHVLHGAMDYEAILFPD